ncbi:hypothetical protein ALC57_11644, partial [Trachymyrmex cornetzi]
LPTYGLCAYPFSGLANTHTNPHCHSLALAIPFRLTCLRPPGRPSSYPSLPPHRLPPFLFSPTVLPDSQPANQHASRLNPRST